VGILVGEQCETKVTKSLPQLARASVLCSMKVNWQGVGKYSVPKQGAGSMRNLRTELVYSLAVLACLRLGAARAVLYVLIGKVAILYTFI